MEEKSYGEVTIGYGTSQERSVPIAKYLKLVGKDHRLASVCELKNGEGYVLAIENPPSSARSNQTIFLSEESMTLLLSAFMFFTSASGGNLEEMFKTCIGKDLVDYYHSENIDMSNVFKNLK